MTIVLILQVRKLGPEKLSMFGTPKPLVLMCSSFPHHTASAQIQIICYICLLINKSNTNPKLQQPTDVHTRDLVLKITYDVLQNLSLTNDNDHLRCFLNTQIPDTSSDLEKQYPGRDLGTVMVDKPPRWFLILKKFWEIPNKVNNEQVLRQYFSHFNMQTDHWRSCGRPVSAFLRSTWQCQSVVHRLHFVKHSPGNDSAVWDLALIYC